MKKSIYTKTARTAGPTVAIFAGVHGNEQVGVLLLDKLINDVDPLKGTIHLVYANPLAIKEKVRFRETNLNRNFLRDNTGTSYEELRAGELMDLLDNCDALLDFHAYNEPDMQKPTFAICEKESFPVVQTFPIRTILSGFDVIQKGSTNGYMENQGKVGIVLELGSVDNPRKYLPLAQICAMNFLSYYGVVIDNVVDKYKQEYLSVETVHLKQNNNFEFKRPYVSFDSVAAGEVIAIDGNQAVVSQHKSAILFPRHDARIGDESFWLLS